MSWIAVAVVGGTVLGGVVQGDASKSAANTQAAAANNASQVQLQMYNQNQANMAPWMQAGGLGLQGLMNYLGVGPNGNIDMTSAGMRGFGPQDFANFVDPGLQFRLQTGSDALVNEATALGGVDSGATRQAITTFGQNLGSQEYQNAWQRYMAQQAAQYGKLSALSGTGLNAAGGIAGLGQTAATNIGNNMMAGANATAAGVVGQANALTGGVSSLYNQYIMGQILARGAPAAAGGGAVPFDPSMAAG